MDTHRTNFEKIKASGMNRILGYLNESNSVVQGLSSQISNLHSNNANNYEQKCLFSDTKNNSTFLESKESVKIPDLILSDPTNVLFGLSASVTNPLERHRDDTMHFDEEDQKSRFILSMTSNISTLCTDTNDDADGTGLALLSRRFTPFSDIDNYARPNNLNFSCKNTFHSTEDDQDPSLHKINLFETGTINPEPGLNRFLNSLPTFEYQPESKPVPQEEDGSKECSKLIKIRGSTIKPLEADSELVARTNKPVIYGLSSDLDILTKNVPNINASTQTDKLNKKLQDNNKKEGSNILPVKQSNIKTGK